MPFVFDIDKTVAAVAYLARKTGGRISIFMLMKMMYAAERRALEGWQRPITGDEFCSMPKGPVLSRTYNLIKREVLSTNSDMQKWAMHFSPRDGNYVRLVVEPDYDYLSEREKEALDKASEEIQALVQKHGKIADVLHKQWPEWRDPATFGRGSVPLTLEEVLAQVLENQDEAENVCSDIRAVQDAKAALQTSPSAT